MRVTLIGHASVLVQMDARTVLMDPVFRDPFEEGAVVSCPKRKVHVDKLPRIDTIVLSHAHLDHFDIPTLAQLPRTADVVFPKDHAIAYTLAQLGFKELKPSDPMARLQGDSFELITTRSSVTGVTEFGMLFRDSSGSFWNQVDSILSNATIDETLKLVGTVDLLFAMHASQNFGFFASRNAGFPHDMHKIHLSRVLRIKPRMTVPGAAGFRFTGPIEWTNAFLFPMSREQFVTDLARLEPSLATQIANPGDVFEIDNGQVVYRPKASPFAETMEDDTRLLRFDPTAAVPPLTDPNVDHYSAARLETGVTEAMDALGSFVQANYAGGDEVVAEYRKYRVRYGVAVVFPNGDERRWRIVFGEEPTIQRDVPDAVDVFHRIAASAVTAWMTSEKSYFYLRAFSRRSSTLYELTRTADDVLVEPRNVPDLLEHYVTRKAKGAAVSMKTRLDLELAPYVRGARCK